MKKIYKKPESNAVILTANNDFMSLSTDSGAQASFKEKEYSPDIYKN